MNLLKALTIKSLKSPSLINASIFLTHSYTNTKPSTNKYFKYQQQSQQKNSRQQRQPLPAYLRIDPSYWEKLLSQIQPQASKLVKLILSSQSSIKEIIKEIQQYLEFRNTTFTENVRTDRGCLAVLVAINQSPLRVNLEEYETRIVDFVTLADKIHNTFDTLMVKYLLFAIHNRMGMNMHKNIRQYYRLKLIDIALSNFDKIQNKDLIQLVSIAQDSLSKDKMNFITKWRFYPFLQVLQERVMGLMKQYASTNNFNKHNEIDMIINTPFLFNFLQIIYFYNYMTQENANILYNFLVKKDTLKREDHHSISGYFNSLCYTPYVQLQGENGKKTTLRKKLIDYFQIKYNNSSFYRKTWADFNLHTKRYTIQRFFEDQFHSVFKSLPFDIIDGKYLVLNKKFLTKPNIPEFVWQLFKQNQHTYLEKYILNDAIRSFYPEKISIQKHSIPNTMTRSAVFSTDNEANLKIWQVLNSLGYKYKKEQNRSQRNVDLLIEQKVIIQVDGQGHYSFLTKQLAPDTSFRNLHLLLSGYKLIIISVYEYNNNRSLQKFSQLIKQKIDLALRQEIVYVC